MSRAVRAILERPGLVLLASVAATLALALPIAGLRYNNGIRIYFDADDEAIGRYDTFVDLFGSDDYIGLAFPVEDAYAPETLRTVDALTRRIQRLPYVEDVRSLTDVENLWAEPGGLVRVGRLIESLEPAAEELAVARREANANPLLERTVVSPDGDVAAVIARLVAVDREVESLRYEAVAAMRSAARELLDEEPFLVGLPVVDAEYVRLSNRDLSRLIPALVVVIALLLRVFFRSTLAVAGVLGVVAMATACAMGLLALNRGETNVLSNTIPLVILVLGLASSVHLLSAYRDHRRTGRAHRRAVEEALAEIARPCVVASVTTALGAASFITSPMPPIREFGIYTACGVLLSALFSLTSLPAALAWAAPRRLGGLARPAGAGAPWRRLGRFAATHPIAVLAPLALGVAAAATGIPRVHADENFLRHYPPDYPLPRSVRFFETHLSPVYGFETVFLADSGAFEDPDLLARLDDFAERLERFDLVERTTSPSHFVKRMNQVLFDGDPARYELPESRDAVAQYLLLLEAPDADIRDYLGADHDVARVTANLRNADSSQFREIAESAEAYLARDFPGIVAFVTGVTELNFRMLDHVIENQVRSLALAIPLVIGAIAVLLRGARLVPLVLVVNLAPIAVTLGVMGHGGFLLDSGTCLVAAISLGIIVDDTVYLLERMRRGAGAGLFVRAIVADALAGVGPALFYTSLIAAAGFAVLGLADFQPAANLGRFVALTIGVAFFAGVLAVPALVALAPGLIEAGTAGRGATAGAVKSPGTPPR